MTDDIKETEEKAVEFLSDTENKKIIDQGIIAIYQAGWAAGNKRGVESGFKEGRNALSRSRAIFIPLAIFLSMFLAMLVYIAFLHNVFGTPSA